MTHTCKSLLLGFAAATFSVSPALADPPCPPFLPSCGFSVSGKAGPYLKRIDAQKLQRTQASELQPDLNGKGLGEHSINQGAVNGAAIYMPQTQAAIQQLIAVIRAQWPYADPGPIRVRMIASTTYGPLARPDNTMVVPLGFLIRAQSDDEVVWVLAHEFSHLALRHFVRTAELERRKRGMDQLVNMLLSGLALSQERAQSTGQTVHFYAVNDPGVQHRSQSMQSWRERVRQMLQLRDGVASRAQEDEADANGADLAIAAGYAADDGSAQAIDGISQDDTQLAKNILSLREQMKLIATQSVTAKGVNSLTAGNIQGAGKEYLLNFGANLGAMMSERAIAYMTKTHREGPARRKGLTNYIAAAYPSLPDRPLRKTWLTAVQASPEFRAAKLAVNAHDLAENDLTLDKASQAAQDLQPALGAAYATTPFVLNTEAKIYVAKNDVTMADRLYDQAEAFGAATVATPVAVASPIPHATRTRHGGRGRAPSSTPAAPAIPVAMPALDKELRQSVDGFKDHIDLLASHGVYQKARQEITAAEGRIGDREPFLPPLIFVSLKTNDAATLMSAYGECQATEDEGLIQQCRNAILSEDQKRIVDQMPPAQREKLDRMLARTGDTVQRTNWLSDLTKSGTSTPVTKTTEPGVDASTTSQ